jgi:hypothetical protein
MLMQVRRAVDHFLLVIPREPPPEARCHAEHVVALNGWSISDPNVASLLAWLNGPWWEEENIKA